MKTELCLILLLTSLFLGACSSDDVIEDPPPLMNTDYTAFTNPELVNIAGYTGEVMEPFFSRDGRFMFFNDMGDNKDIFYASYDAPTDVFTFEGAISVINTPAVEGVPTLDNNGRFYYISTFNYPPGGAQVFDTVYVGDFDPASPAVVNNLAVVPNLDEGVMGHLNFDVEVSPDGTMLYLVDGIFSGNPFPDVSNFIYAKDSGAGFVRAVDSAAIFTNINTNDLEYAACISQDGLEFFFTRLEIATLETKNYRASRTSLTAAFGEPQEIPLNGGFIEAPALSPDEKELYYHRRNPGTNLFELYRVTRP